MLPVPVPPPFDPPPHQVHPGFQHFSLRLCRQRGVLIALPAIFDVGGLRTRLRPSVAAQIRSIAVLPLQNLSGDPNQEYFSDGMTDELITVSRR